MNAQTNPAGDPMVRIRGLSTRLGGKTIFDGVDLDVPRGAVTAIMGPSGTGKTTLLRHITGQLKPDAGEILVKLRDRNFLIGTALTLVLLAVIFLPMAFGGMGPSGPTYTVAVASSTARLSTLPM